MHASGAQAAPSEELPTTPAAISARRDLGLLALGVLALGALMLVRARQYWAFTLDDAYITLRYAKHLAEGLGPSWNPGAEPAEGYTTALWMVVLAIALRVGFNGLWFAKASGIALGLGAVVCAARISQRVCLSAGLSGAPRTLAAVAVFALSASYWPLSLHAVSGMETTFSCLIVSAFFALSVRLASDAGRPAPEVTRDQRLLALAALGCTLTRPEAGLLCTVSLGAHLAGDAAQRRALARVLLGWFVLPGALYLLVRWRHFGLLFPLSFYVKATNRPWFAGLPDVLGFFEPFVLRQPWWALLFVLGVRRAPVLRPALLGAASFVLFFVFPEHIMAFESRYLLPLFPLLSAVIGVGIADVAQHLERAATKPHVAQAAHAALGAALVTCVLLPLPGEAESRAKNWVDYGVSLQRAHVALAHDLAPAQGQGGRIALLDVGAIGYLADWYTIDTFGLNDAHVALHHRQDTEYVLAKRPDLLVIVTKRPGKYVEVFEWETPLYERARAAGYIPVCEYQFDPNYHLQVLTRPGKDTVRGNVCRSSTRLLPLGRTPS